jgi:hypothetical protein
VSSGGNNSKDLLNASYPSGGWFPADIADIRRSHEDVFHMDTSIITGQVKSKM